ncbi:MAG: hypothetical protein JWR90_3843, partial [Marmoricola sp.]|nr:hypothetical protein [Marmoricola sp.]
MPFVVSQPAHPIGRVPVAKKPSTPLDN